MTEPDVTDAAPAPESTGELGVLRYPVPFPRHLPRPPAGRLARRALQTTGVFAGVVASLGSRRVAGKADAQALSRALKRAFEQLGATYLKLGQIVASSPGVFGEATAEEFRSCLDTGPAVPIDAIRRAVEADLGQSMDELFAFFDPEPIGRASLAVVHRATTADGQPVAVKVLRPGIEELIAADLTLMTPLFELLADQLGMEIAGALHMVLDGFREQLEEELDLRNERRTMDHHRLLLERVDLPLVTIPRSYAELSGRQVLTMEYLDGVPIDDLDGIAAFGVDPKPVAQAAIRAWFMSVLRDGTFHGDVHAGNLLLLRDGRLGLIDWGIVGRLDGDTHWFLRRAIEAMLGHEEVWPELVAHLEKLYGPVLAESMQASGDDLSAVLRNVFEPFFNQPFGVFTLAQLMQQFPGAQPVGGGNGRRPVRELARDWLRNRRLRKMGAAQGVNEMPFNRGMMLLIKQLLYFDRYGHLFLEDVALLEDKEFFAAVLREAPLVVVDR